MLRLSTTYEPEISPFLEGMVLSFDPVQQEVHLNMKDDSYQNKREREYDEAGQPILGKFELPEEAQREMEEKDKELSEVQKYALKDTIIRSLILPWQDLLSPQTYLSQSNPSMNQ